MACIFTCFSTLFHIHRSDIFILIPRNISVTVYMGNSACNVEFAVVIYFPVASNLCGIAVCVNSCACPCGVTLVCGIDRNACADNIGNGCHYCRTHYKYNRQQCTDKFFKSFFHCVFLLNLGFKIYNIAFLRLPADRIFFNIRQWLKARQIKQYNISFLFSHTFFLFSRGVTRMETPIFTKIIHCILVFIFCIS